jgi:Protein of unknown function (DUF1566)
MAFTCPPNRRSPLDAELTGAFVASAWARHTVRARLAAVALFVLPTTAIGLGARPAGAQSCVGDCTGTGSVAITDLILGVNIALGLAPVSQCESLDANTDGMVSISELITAVNNALTSQCVVLTPLATTTPSLPSGTATPNPQTPVITTTPSAPTGTATATPTATSLPRFEDNGDGTITDPQTGLIWEKKIGLGSGADAATLHDADNNYSWAGKCSQATTILCQPNAAAAAACVNGVEGDHSGCATCQPGQGTCTIGLGALTTIWDWLGQLNGSGFSGHNDWRLPTEAELASIVDFATTRPAVDEAFDGAHCGPGCSDVTSTTCSCTQSSYYWSASAYKVGSAWGIFYSTTVSSGFAPDTANGYVRAVRSGRAPMPRYLDNGDGTVTDQLTTLTWEKKVQLDRVADPANLHDADDTYAAAGMCASNATTPCQPTADASAACTTDTDGDASSCAQCAEADGSCNVTDTIWTWLTALNAANFAGHTDWRIPTIQELQSIVAYVDAAPAVTVAFHGASCGPSCTDVMNPACSCTQPNIYWSASTYVLDPADAWLVNFEYGFVSASNRATVGSSRVRAVRGGS